MGRCRAVGRYPTLDEMVESAGIGQRRVQNGLAGWRREISLDVTVYPNEDASLMATFPTANSDVEEEFEKAALAETLESRKNAAPDSSYVASLYDKGLDEILKKIGEEATEVVIAAKSGEKTAIIHETADLWFHTLVMLAQQGLSPDDILSELGRRFGMSGLEEKASRKK